MKTIKKKRIKPITTVKNKSSDVYLLHVCVT